MLQGEWLRAQSAGHRLCQPYLSAVGRFRRPKAEASVNAGRRVLDIFKLQVTEIFRNDSFVIFQCFDFFLTFASASGV